jgi:two-component system, cell cycle response regulator DivK
MTAKRQILYIEDNPQNMRLVKKFLRMGGYEMVGAETGEAGIDKAKANRPALILMDINLPDIDGVEATKRLRADAATVDIPIIALTANAMHGDRERFLEAGCDDYLSKPVSKSELLEKVGQVLGATDASDEAGEAGGTDRVRYT